MAADTPGPQIDTSKAHPARVYDFLLGGKDNYRPDWEVGEKLPAAAKESARQNREFMHRAMAWLAGTGIDQFLDIGTGIPTEPNLHQVVQAIVPTARVVYTDYDPIVLRHAQALLVSRPEGITDYIQSDVRDPERILEHARRILDFDRPIALSLISLMPFVPDEDKPHDIVRTLVDALPSGSYLVMSHGSSELLPEMAASVSQKYAASGVALTPRSRTEILRFFDGLDFVDPGLVATTKWFKDTPAPPEEVSGIYAGIARIR
ncbi:SAM-dependent methyltransferase [Streptomyces sp. SL13]|uniref:SAM-dependent methyltransferase n=1 Tax=Streptantibioticus silvisoli TaxID=2705255 RepID=A0AA90H4L1_9ACTN|nr:SAM-dependent methyltransferase [Streptantibioticus silvisoli]MDI5962262.1 SAM-dependent methyltransferase [Streptantibioticus silvisoli]MDI5970690.1 SAM-dependent methyltransferase [Streptantibioticus silvisoli]